MLDDALRVLSRKKMSKGTKQSIYKNGFFVGAGIIAGVGLNDMWRILSLPGNYQRAITAGTETPEVKETRLDEMYQYALVIGITTLSILTGKYTKEVVPMAAGALTGITWSNYAERGGHPISVLPF